MSRAIEYVNCKPADLLAATPRAFFRFTFRKHDYAIWANAQDAGDAIVNEFAGVVPVSALHQSATVIAGADQLVVIDARTTSAPGSARVLDLGEKVADMSSALGLIRVEKFASVPPGGIAEILAGRVNEAKRADADPNNAPLIEKAGEGVSRALTFGGYTLMALAVIVGVAGYFYFTRSGGQSVAGSQ